MFKPKTKGILTPKSTRVNPNLHVNNSVKPTPKYMFLLNKIGNINPLTIRITQIQKLFITTYRVTHESKYCKSSYIGLNSFESRITTFLILRRYFLMGWSSAGIQRRWTPSGPK